VLTTAAIDKVRTDAREFDLARGLLKLVLFPVVAVAWIVANGWKLLAVIIGFVVAGWKVGWHTARGEPI
jgi:hypothetical protein